MPRKLADEEKDLLMRLAGRDFAEIDALREQIECATVEEPEGVEGGAILEFFVGGAVPLQTQDTDLGDGGCRDADGVPIVITLLQKDGYIWRTERCCAVLSTTPPLHARDFGKASAWNGHGSDGIDGVGRWA